MATTDETYSVRVTVDLTAEELEAIQTALMTAATETERQAGYSFDCARADELMERATGLRALSDRLAVAWYSAPTRQMPAFMHGNPIA